MCKVVVCKFLLAHKKLASIQASMCVCWCEVETHELHRDQGRTQRFDIKASVATAVIRKEMQNASSAFFYSPPPPLEPQQLCVQKKYCPVSFVGCNV